MKKGDIVRCTNNYVTDSCITIHPLTVGKEYEILAVDNEFVTVENDKGNNGDYFHSRFELVNKENEEVSNMSNEFIVGGRVECCDALDAEYLTEGKVYEVLDVLANTLTIIDDSDSHGYYRKVRFTPLSEIKPIKVNEENTITASELTTSNNEFKIGGKAVCLDAIGADFITEGKVYDILYMDGNTITIEDDRGVINPFIKRRFNPIKTVDATTITAKGVTITDSEGNVVSGIDETGEPYTVKHEPLSVTTNELQVKDSEGNTTLKIVDDGSLSISSKIIDASTQIIQLPVDVNVLGTTYTIEVIPVEEDSYLEGIYGYCDFLTKSIVLRQLKPTDYFGNIDAINAQYKTNLRHELMHAFLYESGLDGSTLDGWARNEEMIDFMALQLPKIFKAFNDCGITE